jgi:hypothetical protein
VADCGVQAVMEILQVEDVRGSLSLGVGVSRYRYTLFDDRTFDNNTRDVSERQVRRVSPQINTRDH